MGKEDFRTVDEDVRYVLRRCAIWLITDGKKKKDVAETLGVKAGTISDWVKLHRQGGDAALRCKKRNQGRSVKTFKYRTRTSGSANNY